MNLKNFLLPLTLALLTTWAIQYFFINRYMGSSDSAKNVVQSGQTFVAPQSHIATQPLNKSLDFIPASHDEQLTRIETDKAIYVFSTHGACLKQLIFKRIIDGKQIALSTMSAQDQDKPENKCLLVALQKETPMAYQLVEQKDLEKLTHLVYQARTDQAVIQKEFIINHETFAIELKLSITPSATPVQVRIFYGAPFIRDLASTSNGKNDTQDVIAAIYNAPNNSIQKELLGKLDFNKGWYAPTFFGADDRYFIHAMVADAQGFVQRAYYTVAGPNSLISILESSPISEPTQWSLSFYLGPKEEEIMNLVDPRLAQTLDYSGWLAPFSRLLLAILKYLNKFVHNYGWAIVLMTVLINLLLLPLNLKSAQGIKKHNEFQKKLAYISQRYKDDPETLAREKNEIISKQGLSSLGGCLPKLLQLPIFFALSRVLSSSIELYKAPFGLWIHDLSARDPYYVLPILITLSMMFMTPTTDPKQRFTMIAIGLVFGAVAVNFSAGLCLYILVGIILTGIQTFLQGRIPLKWM